MTRRRENALLRGGACEAEHYLRKKADNGVRCVLSEDNHMACSACGQMFPHPLGDIRWCVDVMKAFVRAHRNCRKPDAAARAQ